jgi:hypothetical protein
LRPSPCFTGVAATCLLTCGCGCEFFLRSSWNEMSCSRRSPPWLLPLRPIGAAGTSRASQRLCSSRTVLAATSVSTPEASPPPTPLVDPVPRHPSSHAPPHDADRLSTPLPSHFCALAARDPRWCGGDTPRWGGTMLPSTLLQRTAPPPKSEETSKPSSLLHAMFGMVSYRRTLLLGLPLLHLWLCAPVRAFLFHDAPTTSHWASLSASPPMHPASPTEDSGDVQVDLLALLLIPAMN